MSSPGIAENRARKRAKDLSALRWHTSFFLVVNGLLWVQDIVGGGGLEWAYITTIAWGAGLTIHMLAYLFDSRHRDERYYQRFLDHENRREAHFY